MRTVRVTRYVTPLREGGSLPAIVEADDDGMYVLKFRGAGQGVKALIAELVSGEIARALGLPVPELVFAELDPDLARTEPDPEIFALIRDSAGLNLALDYLPSSVMFDPVVEKPAADLASRIVWFDAYVTNVDRSARNTNMLMWHRRLWLIDHGATLFFHHSEGWVADGNRAREPFPLIKGHVLLTKASQLREVDAGMAAMLTADVIERIVDLIPESWLERADTQVGPYTSTDTPAARGNMQAVRDTRGNTPAGRDARAETPAGRDTKTDAAADASAGTDTPVGHDTGAAAQRRAYQRYLVDRLAPPRAFVEEAVRVR